jgi:hypothetical protein
VTAPFATERGEVPGSIDKSVGDVLSTNGLLSHHIAAPPMAIAKLKRKNMNRRTTLLPSPG